MLDLGPYPVKVPLIDPTGKSNNSSSSSPKPKASKALAKKGLTFIHK